MGLTRREFLRGVGLGAAGLAAAEVGRRMSVAGGAVAAAEKMAERLRERGLESMGIGPEVVITDRYGIDHRIFPVDETRSIHFQEFRLNLVTMDSGGSFEAGPSLDLIMDGGYRYIDRDCLVPLNDGTLLFFTDKKSMGTVPTTNYEIRRLRINGNRLEQIGNKIDDAGTTESIRFMGGVYQFTGDVDLNRVTTVVCRDCGGAGYYGQVCNMVVGTDGQVEMSYADTPDQLGEKFNIDKGLYLGNGVMFCFGQRSMGIVNIASGEVGQYVLFPDGWGKAWNGVPEVNGTQPVKLENGKIVFVLKGNKATANEGKTAVVEFDSQTGENRFTPIVLTNKNVGFVWADKVGSNDLVVSFSENNAGPFDRADFAVRQIRRAGDQWQAVGSKQIVGTGFMDFGMNTCTAGKLGNSVLASYPTYPGYGSASGRLISPDLTGITPVPTATGTSERTRTPTPTVTVEVTETPTATITKRVTETPTGTVTSTETVTGTRTPTGTLTPTSTETITVTKSPTGTPTRRETETRTLTPTATITKRVTETPTGTVTSTETVTGTRTPTGTLTPTSTETITVTKSPTGTPTRRETETRTLTPTATITRRVTETPSGTGTAVVTETVVVPTGTPTPTPERTVERIWLPVVFR